MTPWIDTLWLQAHPEIWPEANTLDPATLTIYLEGATIQAAEFAPALADLAPVPVTWQLAVAYQAREVYAAARRDGDLIGGQVGADAYPLRARPLTGTVQQLLRPRRGRPSVG